MPVGRVVTRRAPAGRNAVYTILVAVDGSQHSHRAARYANQRAQATRCTVHLVHVGEPVMAWEVGPVSSSEVVERLHEAESAKVLDDGAKQFDATVGVECHSVAGEPAQTILELADAIGADEIIVGSRGMRALGTAMLGSVASSVVHDAKVPVVVVR